MLKNAVIKVGGAISFSFDSGEPRFSVAALSAINTTKTCTLDEPVQKNTFWIVGKTLCQCIGDKMLSLIGLVKVEYGD